MAPATKRNQAPTSYQVVVFPKESTDPKAVAAVLAFIRKAMGLDLPKAKPPSVRAQLRALKLKIGQCQGCGFKPGVEDFTRALHVHHIIPKAKGGDNEERNLLVLCARCHAIAHSAFRKRKATRSRVIHRLAFMAFPVEEEKGT